MRACSKTSVTDTGIVSYERTTIIAAERAAIADLCFA